MIATAPATAPQHSTTSHEHCKQCCRRWHEHTSVPYLVWSFPCWGNFDAPSNRRFSFAANTTTPCQCRASIGTCSAEWRFSCWERVEEKSGKWSNYAHATRARSSFSIEMNAISFCRCVCMLLWFIVSLQLMRMTKRNGNHCLEQWRLFAGISSFVGFHSKRNYVWNGTWDQAYRIRNCWGRRSHRFRFSENFV